MREFVLLGVVALVILVTPIVITAIPFNRVTRDNGEHTGYVTAIENERGILLPNNRTVVYVKTELSSSQEDVYCVQDSETELITSLKEASKEKKNVSIKFSGIVWTGWFNCSGDRIIGVETVN
jgi:hypothetical protein